jgi:hypothetical protein
LVPLHNCLPVCWIQAFNIIHGELKSYHIGKAAFLDRQAKEFDGYGKVFAHPIEYFLVFVLTCSISWILYELCAMVIIRVFGRRDTN